MPPMRLAVCFDGRITIHDHIPTNNLIALPFPHVSNATYSLHYAFLVTVRQSIHLILSNTYPPPARTCSPSPSSYCA